MSEREREPEHRVPQTDRSTERIVPFEDLTFKETFGSGSTSSRPSMDTPTNKRSKLEFSTDFSLDPSQPMFTVKMDEELWSAALVKPTDPKRSLDIPFMPGQLSIPSTNDILKLSGYKNGYDQGLKIHFKTRALEYFGDFEHQSVKEFEEHISHKITSQLETEGLQLKVRIDSTMGLVLSAAPTTGELLGEVNDELKDLKRAMAIAAEVIFRSLNAEPNVSEITIKNPPIQINEGASTQFPLPSNPFSSIFADKALDDQRLVESLEVKGLSRKLSDMGGNPELKEQIERLILQVKDRQYFTDRGLDLPRGVLLYGPPGTGKTLAGEIIASEVGRRFYKLTASDFITAFYGESEKKLDAILSGIKEPCVVFIDEIDSIGENRERLSEPSRRVLNKLLEKMDGLGSERDIVFIAATNRKDSLDPALTRPGRFDRHLFVGLPDKEARKQIFNIHLGKASESSIVKLFEDSIDHARLASESEGLVGADIEEIVRRAKEKNRLSFIQCES